MLSPGLALCTDLSAPIFRIITVFQFQNKKGLVVGFGFNGPLRQYFSLYWAVIRKEQLLIALRNCMFFFVFFVSAVL